MTKHPDAYRQALSERKNDWNEIAKRCDLSRSWIYQFVIRKTNNPRYETLTRLEAELFPKRRAARPAKAEG